MIAEIMTLMKLAHEGGVQTLIIVVLSLAWLRERQQVHQLGAKAFELVSVVVGPEKAPAAVEKCIRRAPDRVGPGDVKNIMTYAIRKLKEKDDSG